MYYRRKVILSLLQLFNDRLEKIRLQKLLFLFCQEQEKPDYDFVPYKYGCFSFSATADLNTMVKKGLIAEVENDGFRRTDKTDYFKSLKPADQKSLRLIKARYDEMNSTALMRHTYLNFPFFAINSVKSPTILSKDEFARVAECQVDYRDTVLFTIGYEGLSLEEYLNRLIKNGVKLLIDVRRNPLSMKYGFSKSQLKKFCENLGVQYVHFPEVGIQSEKRQQLHDQRDYDRLFVDYRKRILPGTRDTQHTILKLLEKHRRIALTCFEANICHCHRKHLAEAIQALPEFSYYVKHI